MDKTDYNLGLLIGLGNDFATVVSNFFQARLDVQYEELHPHTRRGIKSRHDLRCAVCGQSRARERPHIFSSQFLAAVSSTLFNAGPLTALTQLVDCETPTSLTPASE